MAVTYLTGDVRDVIADIPDSSVALCATSPPFISLRSYLPRDHPEKWREIGQEADPATFLETLLALTAEFGRVLYPWGSIAIELGDTYAGSGGAGGDYNEGGRREGQNAFIGSSALERSTSTKRTRVISGSSPILDLHGRVQGGGHGWPRPKCLALVPQLFAGCLAYGRNLLTGEVFPGGRWLVRNVIVWHRPNPTVGALGDKFRPSTSHIIVATRSPRRWFDLSDIRAAGETLNDTWTDYEDTWTMSARPSRLAHFAMWPPRLAERLVLSMCPLEVCAACGEPRRRMTELVSPRQVSDDDAGKDRVQGRHVGGPFVKSHTVTHAVRETSGWSDCGHDAFVPGVVLDPFAGTGTTLAAADLHGRDAIGIDVDERNRDLYPSRWDEVKQALFGVRPEMPGQLSLDDAL